jgi:hypothetical protein
MKEIKPLSQITQADRLASQKAFAAVPTEEEIHQRFQQLPQAEQQRINNLNPSMRLTALRALGNSQLTQTTQPTPNPQDDIADVPPAKIAEADAYARSLPDNEQILLGQLSPAKRLCRIWELKDRDERRTNALFNRK